MLRAASRSCNSWRIFSSLSEPLSLSEARSDRAEELEKKLNELKSQLEKEQMERMVLREKLGELTTKFTQHKLEMYKATQYDQQRLRQLQQPQETLQQLQQTEKIKPVAGSIDELTSKLAVYSTAQYRQQQLRPLQQTSEKIQSAGDSLTPSIDREGDTVAAAVLTAPELQLQHPEKMESAVYSLSPMMSQEEATLPAARSELQQLPAADSISLLKQEEQSEKNVKLHEICDPSSILQSYRIDTPGTIPVEQVQMLLQPFLNKIYDIACYCPENAGKTLSESHWMGEARSDRADELEKRLSALKSKMEKERKESMDLREKHGEPTTKFTQHQLTMYKATQYDQQRPRSTALLHQVVRNPSNILLLYHSDTPETISYELARNRLEPLYSKTDKVFIPYRIIEFFSEEHSEKARASGGHVSVGAVKYWLNWLEALQLRLQNQELPAKLHEFCHPTNIFQLCRTDAPESIPFESAHDILQSAFNKCTKEAFKQISIEEVECDVCEKTCTNAFGVVRHFLSTTHRIAACVLNANVSLAAVNHWLGVLQKVAATESAAQPEQPLQLFESAEEAPQMQHLPAAVQQSQPENAVILHEICHPTNVLQLCHSDTPKTIPFESARDLLQPFFAKCYEGEFARYCHATEKMIFSCKLCSKDVTKYQTPFHFFTKEHIEKARASGGNVSLAAIKYWLFEVLQVASSAARPELQQQSAAQNGLMQSDPAAAAAKDVAPHE